MKGPVKNIGKIENLQQPILEIHVVMLGSFGGE